MQQVMMCLSYCAFIGKGWKYREGGEHIVTILSPRGENIGGWKYRITPAVARPLAASPAGTTSAVPDCSTNHSSADRISGQFLFYHDHNFTKSKENLRFRRLVPLFVPIGVCVTTHDDGTASDNWFVTSQSTGHEPRAQRQTLVFTPKVA